MKEGLFYCDYPPPYPLINKNKTLILFIYKLIYLIFSFKKLILFIHILILMMYNQII